MKPKPAVLIRTLPFSSGNYGGVLQAYALQRKLREMGADAVTDTSAPARRSYRFVRRTYRALRSAIPARLDWRWRSGKYVNRRLDDYVGANIKTVDLVARATTTRGLNSLLSQIDTVVIGSDQVWRAAYTDVASAFMTVLDGQPIQRVSYAASFGRGDLSEYTGPERRLAGEQLRQFEAISVREIDAIDLCAQEWGVTAVQHIDPTMLLSADDYRKVFAEVARSEARRVVVYGLDGNDLLDRVAESVSRKIGASLDVMLPSSADSYATFRADARRYEKRSIESWLASIADAEFLVTDSFHGCVFAILFNTPFVVCANPERGSSRITSLLRTFGLESHLVNDVASLDGGFPNANWAHVEKVLRVERERAVSYLGAVLGQPNG
jgi:hypothetical protein